jgi:spore coat protein CotH
MLRYRFLILVGASFLLLTTLLSAVAPPILTKDAEKKNSKSEAKTKPSKHSFFGHDKVHRLHLELSELEWDRMQRVVGGSPFGPGGMFGNAPEPPKAKPGEEPLTYHKAGGFGTLFPWAHANLTYDGELFANIGLRYKGNASYTTAGKSLKRNLKIEIDHFNEQLRLLTMKTLNLNAAAMDPTRMREAMAFSVFRAANVPAPRTAFAEVTLSVKGKYDKELLGVYTLIEQVDKAFLKDRFKTSKGLLFKPERVRGLEYFGEDWTKYTDRYRPKREATAKESKRLIDFTRLVNKGSDEEFNKQIADYLDIDAFLRYMAVNAMIVNVDSFFTFGHNYYIYHHPETNKYIYFPWDLDLSFGGFGMFGGPEQQAQLSVMKHYNQPSKLPDRLMAMKGMTARYQRIVREIAANAFNKERLVAEMDEIDHSIKELVAKERKATEARKEPPPRGLFGEPVPPQKMTDLRPFLNKRVEGVMAQLDGKTNGFVPPTFSMFGPKPPVNPLLKPLMDVADTDKDRHLSKEELLAAVRKFSEQADKSKGGKLDERDLGEMFAKMMPPPVFGGIWRGPTPAPQVVKRADANEDGKVTLPEMLDAAEKLFIELDKTKRGKLDEKDITAGIDRLLPPPPWMGVPGKGPGMPPGGFPPKKEEKKL